MSAALGPLKFTMTSDYGASSHFVDSNLIGDIEARMKGIVKLDPPVAIVVAGRRTLRGVSIGTLTVRVTEPQEFSHDMLLPAMNVPGLRRHLFLGGTAVVKGFNTVIVEESYADVGRSKSRVLHAKIRNALHETTSISTLLRGATVKRKQRSQRGLSQGTQYLRGRLWPSDFSGAGPWGRSPLSQQRHGHLSLHLWQPQVYRCYRPQLQLMARA